MSTRPGGGPTPRIVAAAARRVKEADFLFAGSHALEGAVTAFARGADPGAIRDAAAGAYATGQGKAPARVRGAFTNPGVARRGRPR
jgi:hypothetical protein